MVRLSLCLCLVALVALVTRTDSAACIVPSPTYPSTLLWTGPCTLGTTVTITMSMMSPAATLSVSISDITFSASAGIVVQGWSSFAAAPSSTVAITMASITGTAFNNYLQLTGHFPSGTAIVVQSCDLRNSATTPVGCPYVTPLCIMAALTGVGSSVRVTQTTLSGTAATVAGMVLGSSSGSVSLSSSSLFFVENSISIQPSHTGYGMVMPNTMSLTATTLLVYGNSITITPQAANVATMIHVAFLLAVTSLTNLFGFNANTFAYGGAITITGVAATGALSCQAVGFTNPVTMNDVDFEFKLNTMATTSMQISVSSQTVAGSYILHFGHTTSIISSRVMYTQNTLNCPTSTNSATIGFNVA